MIQIPESPLLEVCDPFDAHMIQLGPPAFFRIDARKRLRMDANRTRICWENLNEVPDRKLCHALVRDPGTGWIQYVLVTAPALLSTLEARLFPTQQAALEALAEHGSPPVGPLS